MTTIPPDTADAAKSPIFQPTDADALTRAGHLKPAHGRRREVSSHLMSEEYISSSSGSEDTQIVPDLLVSPETLIYLGWGQQKAGEIWRRWREIKEAETEDGREVIFEMEFLDFVLERYVPEVNISNDREASIEQMELWGLAGELINCIMASAFEDVRTTETIQYWVRDTMSIRYLGLEGLQKNSARRDEKRRNGTDDDGSEIRAAVARAPSSTAPGYTLLFKAISSTQVGYLPDGSMDIESLTSLPPTDFRGRVFAPLYFTPSLRVAKVYRDYARNRTSSPVLMIQMNVPNSFIEALPPYICSFGDLWKQVVYTCRGGNNLRGTMARIHSHALIIAPIAKGDNNAIARLRDWREVTMNNAMHVDGEEAIQICVSRARRGVRTERDQGIGYAIRAI
ncbi:hypothetical protein BCON_0230g00040 [Botryotinia convoluta]|uniref:Uncharacterized protein n=1 Tax=Botryotinia convoluta TaxID=54673 RepID=A0A4Z1HJF4_9HELO|nr:hypothetical protein BCON_0230g00040 [Botryotinia convoluta]